LFSAFGPGLVISSSTLTTCRSQMVNSLVAWLESQSLQPTSRPTGQPTDLGASNGQEVHGEKLQAIS